MLIPGKTYDMVAKTLPGLEQVLADELSALGASNVRPMKRAVRFHGGKELLYRSNYHLRTALKILKPIHEFSARDESELYIRTNKMNWSEYFSVDHTFTVDALVFSQSFKHSGYVALKVKDAIVDNFRDRTGRRPNVDTKRPDIVINIHISNQQCTISLDSTGKSLHKRGYRSDHHKAPLNEVLAAGMLQLAGWKPEYNLLDPMCGSGTIVIEAGLMANDIPPGSFRKSFVFQNWLDYDPGLFQKIKLNPGNNRLLHKGEISGSDRSSEYVVMSRKNVEQAGLKGLIKLDHSSIENISPKWTTGIIIMNPPYGDRMQAGEVNVLYRTIGDILKRDFSGFDAWILSSNKEALKNVGLHASRKITLFNGPTEVRFQKYELYRGSKKQQRK